MSKRYFINNLDTDFGQTLLEELIKEGVEDPVHMCTTRIPFDSKPNGIKKILKREKPKLFRKRVVEECDVFVYNLNHTEISDIEFGIETMQKPIEDSKVFILVSDIMAWSNSGKKEKKEPKKEGDEEAEEGEEKPEDEEQKEEKEAKEESLDKEGSEEEHEENEEKQNEQQAEGEEEFESEKIIEYTFFEDFDYAQRKPLEKYAYIKEIEDKVLALTKENLRVFVICPGLIYGCGEENLYPIFKAAWLQEPNKLPYLRDGSNQVPMIHLKDLVKFVIKVSENPPEEESSPYLLAFDENSDRTQKDILYSISKGVGSGEIESVENSDLFENPDRFLIDIDIKPSKYLVGTEEEPSEFEWTAKEGIKKNINSILKEFCQKHLLKPIKLLFLQNDENWRKSSKIDFIYKIIPVLTIKDILNTAKIEADTELKEDLKEEEVNINEYLLKNEERNLDETMKVFYRAVRWRLSQNDCLNRGFILENFPNFKEELNHIFMKVSSKKLKRKRKPIPKVKKPKSKKQESEQEIEANAEKEEKSIKEIEEKEPKEEEEEEEQEEQEEQEEEEEENKNKISSKSIESNKEQQEEEQQEEQEEEEEKPEEEPEPEEEEEELDEEATRESKREPSFPSSIISIKEMGKEAPTGVIDFFTSEGIEELSYDTTDSKENEIFESLRNYIEREGRPNNYLIEESELLERRIKFTEKENENSLKSRQDNIKAKEEKAKIIENQRIKLRDEIIDIVRTEGEEEIKKMPYRNYLMEFVVPILNEGLLEVSNIIPNDPVDLLAEYLYQKSYDC